MAASQSGIFSLQEFSDIGAPLVGGRLYTYVYGTTTHKTAYTDKAGTIPHTYTSDGIGGQYIALNARGELPAPLYLAAGSYDIALKDSTGATIWTRRADPIEDSSSAIRSELASASGASEGAGMVGFNPSMNYAAATIGWALKQNAINVMWFSSVRTAVSGGTSAASALMSVYQMFCTQSGGARPLYCPAGTYLFDASFIADVSGTVLFGDPGQTIWKRMDYANGPTLTTAFGTHTGMNIMQTGFQGRYGPGIVYDVYIDGITFDGNKANNILNPDDNFDNCIAPLYATRFRAVNCTLKNAKRIGCALSTNADDAVVSGCHAYDCDYGGIYVEVSKNVRVESCHAARCGVVGVLGYGGICFSETTGGGAFGCTTESCYDGIRVRNRCSDTSISGGSTRLSTRYGIFIQDEALGNASTFTGSISGTTLTVSAISAGSILARQVITGTGVKEDTVIESQLTGSAGSTGTYQVSKSQTVGSIAMVGARTPTRTTIVGHAISGCANDSIYAFHAAHVTCSASPVQTDAAYGIHYQNVRGGRVDCDVSGATTLGVFIDAGCSNIAEAWTTGTYTPVVSGASTAGTGTYSTQTGRYTKDGNRCSMYAVAAQSGHTGSGDARISLPFPANASDGTVLATAVYNTAFTGQVVALVVGGQAYARLMVNNGGTLSPLALPAGAMTVVVSGEFEMP